MHRFSVITLFPELITAFAEVGLVRKARSLALVDIATINPRDFTDDKRRTVDDVAYGGGPGMVMCVAPLRAAISTIKTNDPSATVIYLTPQGRRLDQKIVTQLVAKRHVILLAGRYEGVDERLIERDVDDEISIGDYVLSGGELPTMVLIEAMVRLIPGVLGDPLSAEFDSFGAGLLDHPHYTRPEVVDGQAVPAVLLSGDHAAIAQWRLRQAVMRTLARRPDLLAETISCPDVAKIIQDISEQNAQISGRKG